MLSRNRPQAYEWVRDTSMSSQTTRVCYHGGQVVAKRVCVDDHISTEVCFGMVSACELESFVTATAGVRVAMRCKQFLIFGPPINFRLASKIFRPELKTELMNFRWSFVTSLNTRDAGESYHVCRLEISHETTVERKFSIASALAEIILITMSIFRKKFIGA